MNRGSLTGRHREQARSYSLIGYIRMNQVGQSAVIVGMPPRPSGTPLEDQKKTNAHRTGLHHSHPGSSNSTGNSSEFDQSGTGNQAFTNQMYGSDNQITVKQADSTYVAYVTQGGTGNVANVDQSGAANQATVLQQ